MTRTKNLCTSLFILMSTTAAVTTWFYPHPTAVNAWSDSETNPLTQVNGPVKNPGVPTIFQLADDPLLRTAFYLPTKGTRVAEDGANSVNAAWERGTSPSWYIELQRFGADDIQAGILTNRPNLVSHGEKILDWGFAHQSGNGGFNGSSDAFHSTSFMIEATAHSLLVMRQSNPSRYQNYIRTTLPKLEQAARWITSPSVEPAGIRHNAPYTHRRYLLAAALGETAALTADSNLRDSLSSQAIAFAKDGLSLQDQSGFNPEKNGYDSSYNVAGLSFASNYYSVCPDPNLRNQLKHMIARGLSWETTRMNRDGSANLTGNTRVTSNPKTDELGRGSTPKTFSYSNAIKSYVFGYKITGNQAFYREAQLIAKYQKYLP